MRHRNVELRIGFGLAAVSRISGFAAAGVIGFILLAHGHGRRDAILGYFAAYGLVLASLLVAVVVHELGHLLAALLTGSRVTAIWIGSPPALATFTIRNLEVQLGIRPHGRLVHDRPASARRKAFILAAGPAANVVSGLVLLVLPLQAFVRYPGALAFAVVGMTNLLPFRTHTGTLSDGAQLARGKRERIARQDVRALLATPGWKARPDAADRLLRGIQFEVPAAASARSQLAALLLDAGRVGDLLWLHRQRVSLTESPATRWVRTVHAVEWAVASIADLPLADANEAGRRMAWVINHSSPQDRAIAQHTLAVIRLRQGLPGEVEPLCAGLLTSSLPPSRHATVLASVAMARHAQGLPGHEVIAEALQLDPHARLVQEAVSRLAGPHPGLRKAPTRSRTLARSRMQ